MELAVGQKVRLKSRAEHRKMELDYFDWLAKLEGKIVTIVGTKLNREGKQLVTVSGGNSGWDLDDDWLFPRRFTLVGSETEIEE